jgi:hypothetical protein
MVSGTLREHATENKQALMTTHSTAFIDPTHVNIIAEGTFPLYFGDQSPTSPWAVIYGFKGAFKVVSEEWRGPHLLTVLQKIPPRDNL